MIGLMRVFLCLQIDITFLYACYFVYFLFINQQPIIQKAEVDLILTLPIDKIGFIG